MFVSVRSFVLVLSISVSRATENTNVALKDQLARSLTHVSEMLVDMEDKIEQERKILSQIDNNLNHKDHSDEVLLTHPDYDSVTEIWWTSANSTGAAVTGKYGNVTITIKTTPSLFPRPPQTSTFATVPSHWNLPTTSESPFVSDMKQNMALSRHGYFITFAERFTELVYTKNESEAYPVVYYISLLLKKNAEDGTLKSLGVDLLGRIEFIFAWFEILSPRRVKEQAGVLHYMLKILDQAMSDDIKSLLRFYDDMFTKEEGEELFKSLEPFHAYPEGNITFLAMAERIFDATLAPYIKSEGKRKQKRLVQHILMAAHDLDPDFRAQTMSSLENANVNYSTKDHNQSAFPKRRSMNYKKIVKHFFVKHPKLFKRVKRQYKHDKKNEHHRFSLTWKRDLNYRKSRSGHQRHRFLYDREQTREKAPIESSYEPENEKVEADASESGAYYHENSRVYQQRNTHKEQSIQNSKIQLDKLNHYTQKQRYVKQKQWNLFKKIQSTTKPYQDDPQYLKQLAIRFLRNKQQRQNFYRNRRFNIPSLEEEICNDSQNFQDSVENDMLYKIKEASSYSDEENHLRNNLYDALRHGNRTFVSFRKSDGGLDNKQTLRALSSETDDEWVLKNKIYKVFEYEKK